MTVIVIFSISEISLLTIAIELNKAKSLLLLVAIHLIDRIKID